MTLDEALAAGTRVLAESHVQSPQLTAEVLLAHCLGSDRSFLYTHGGDDLDESIAQVHRSLIIRRSSREPLQYITGIQEFYGRTFSVGPSVLIPRPETELVVDAILDLNAWEEPRIVDVGTGSGCIAITLALEIPRAVIWASDISVEAVRTARRNAYSLRTTVQFACMGWTDAWGGTFEIVASNPPYVTTDEHAGLEREVREHEPELALSGDGNPLNFYRRLQSEAHARLVTGGIVAVEIGYSMEEAVRDLFGPEWELLPTRSDLQGIPRVVTARKR